MSEVAVETMATTATTTTSDSTSRPRTESNISVNYESDVGNNCGSNDEVCVDIVDSGSDDDGDGGDGGDGSGGGSGQESGDDSASRESGDGSNRVESVTARHGGGPGVKGGGRGGGKKSARQQKGEAYIEGDIKLRFLCPDDVDAVKVLCRDWFPVEYPDFWYKDITNDKRFFSLAAAFGSSIVGLLVAEVKTRARCHREDSNILSTTFPGTTQVAYILSLGVVEEYRRKGIASAMLENFLTSLSNGPRAMVKAVYLHVLASNTGAIKFYEKHKFQRHEFLPYYYSIHGQARDGLSYCLYLNGGQPPWTLIDYMKHFGSYMRGNQLCNLPHAMARQTRNFFSARRSWVHMPHLPNMPSMPNMPSINMPNINMPNILSRFRGQGSPAGEPSGEAPAGDCSDSSSSSSLEAVAVIDEEAGASSVAMPDLSGEVVTIPMGAIEGAEPSSSAGGSSSSRRSWLPKAINKASMPSMPKPSMPKSMPSMPKSMPSMPKSMPSMPKSMPSMPKSMPSMPSMPSGMSLLTRFGGQCYDSGEQKESEEEHEEYTNAEEKL